MRPLCPGAAGNDIAPDTITYNCCHRRGYWLYKRGSSQHYVTPAERASEIDCSSGGDERGNHGIQDCGPCSRYCKGRQRPPVEWMGTMRWAPPVGRNLDWLGAHVPALHWPGKARRYRASAKSKRWGYLLHVRQFRAVKIWTGYWPSGEIVTFLMNDGGLKTAFQAL